MCDGLTLFRLLEQTVKSSITDETIINIFNKLLKNKKLLFANSDSVRLAYIRNLNELLSRIYSNEAQKTDLADHLLKLYERWKDLRVEYNLVNYEKQELTKSFPDNENVDKMKDDEKVFNLQPMSEDSYCTFLDAVWSTLTEKDVSEKLLLREYVSRYLDRASMLIAKLTTYIGITAKLKNAKHLKESLNVANSRFEREKEVELYFQNLETLLVTDECKQCVPCHQECYKIYIGLKNRLNSYFIMNDIAPFPDAIDECRTMIDRVLAAHRHLHIASNNVSISTDDRKPLFSGYNLPNRKRKVEFTLPAFVQKKSAINK